MTEKKPVSHGILFAEEIGNTKQCPGCHSTNIKETKRCESCGHADFQCLDCRDTWQLFIKDLKP